MILFLDELIDQTPSIGRGDFFHDALDGIFASLKLLDIILKILGVDMLLLSFNVFPAFGALLSLEGEQSELGVVVGETILQRMLVLHDP